jgi:hypothetical protein
VLLTMSERKIAASGNVSLGLDFNTDGTPEISLSAFFSFELSYRPNGSQVIKIFAGNLSFALGDPADPVLEFGGFDGYFVITQQGMAARIEIPSYSLNFSGAARASRSAAISPSRSRRWTRPSTRNSSSTAPAPLRRSPSAWAGSCASPAAST